MVGRRLLQQITPKKVSTPTSVSCFKLGPPCSPDALFSQIRQLVRLVKETQIQAQLNDENRLKEGGGVALLNKDTLLNYM